MKNNDFLKKATIFGLFVLLFVTGSVITIYAQSGMTGDVDGNGVVDINDALKVARYCAGLPNTKFDVISADVKMDGTVNIQDALIIAQYSAGLIPCVTCIPTPTPTPTRTPTPTPTCIPCNLTIAVRVKDSASNLPLANAVVELAKDSNSILFYAITDASGYAVVTGSRCSYDTSKIWLNIMKEGYTDYFEYVTFTCGQTTTKEVLLALPTTLPPCDLCDMIVSGKVTDSRTGLPIANVIIGTPGLTYAFSDANGNYTLVLNYDPVVKCGPRDYIFAAYAPLNVQPGYSSKIGTSLEGHRCGAYSLDFSLQQIY